MRTLLAAILGGLAGLAIVMGLASLSAAESPKHAAMMGAVTMTPIDGKIKVTVKDVNGEVVAERLVTYASEITTPHKGHVGVIFTGDCVQVFRNTHAAR